MTHPRTLFTATLLSRLGQPCKIKSPTPITVRCNEQPVATKNDADDVYEFPTTSGKMYVITLSNQ